MIPSVVPKCPEQLRPIEDEDDDEDENDMGEFVL
jgi:hypothetical protein